MYDAVVDSDCYDGTTVLKNIPGLRDQAALDQFEAAMTAQRADEPLPSGHLSVSHYRAIHYHLFQDVYRWAGAYRTVRMSKGSSAFCYPEHIARQMTDLFDGLKHRNFLRNLSASEFAAQAAGFLATLNAIHPFREGNGRAQTIFLVLLAHRAGHPLDVERLVPERFLQAMIVSFEGDEESLRSEITGLVG